MRLNASTSLRLSTVECGTVRTLGRDVASLVGASRRVLLALVPSPLSTGCCPDLAGIARRAQADGVLLLLSEAPLTLPWLADLAAQAAAMPSVAVTEASDPDVLFQLEELGFRGILGSPLSAGGLLPRMWRLAANAPAAAADDDPPEPAGVPEIPGLVGRSQAFRAQVAKVGVVARSRAAVLIRGETGTGKELVARAIHDAAGAPRAPFVPVNCGAIPTDLVESELFGHGRSAFTGAQAERAGLIDEAAGGTLFLDEVDSLPLAAQVKLLRFLQDKEFRRLGSTQARKSDARIIAATSADVERAVETGHLRRDLYYRLNVLSIDLPALRERRDDIPLLAHYFIETLSRELGRRPPVLGAGVIERLLAHDWPGNVRELEHVVYRALVLSEGRPGLDRRDIEIAGSESAPGATSFREAKARVVTRFEKAYVTELLAAAAGNISQAALSAGKNRRALFELIRKHRIDASAFRRST